MFATDRRTKLVTLGTMCFALFMVMLDSTVVNLALPTIQRKLGASITELQWIVDAFILALASLLLTGGTLGDMFGRRRAFLGGLALFTGGSLACALSPSSTPYRRPRASGRRRRRHDAEHAVHHHQHLPRPRERAKAIGIWAGVRPGAGHRPLIGGTMVDSLGWQSIFLINVPDRGPGLAFAWRFVPESADRDGRSLDLPVRRSPSWVWPR